MSTTSPLRWLGIGLVALGAAVSGVYIREQLISSPQDKAATAALKTLDPSTATPAANPGAIPTVLPDFTLHDLQGKARPIRSWVGHPLMLNFWASWCAPCRREIPLLNQLQAEPPVKDLKIVGIAVDFVDDVKAFMDKMPIRYDVLTGEQDGLDAANALGVQAVAFPFTVFLDHQGQILSLHMGELHENQARATLNVLSRLEGGQINLPQARMELKAALAALDPTPSAT